MMIILRADRPSAASTSQIPAATITTVASTAAKTPGPYNAVCLVMPPADGSEYWIVLCARPTSRHNAASTRAAEETSIETGRFTESVSTIDGPLPASPEGAAHRAVIEGGH